MLSFVLIGVLLFAHDAVGTGKSKSKSREESFDWCMSITGYERTNITFLPYNTNTSTYDIAAFPMYPDLSLVSTLSPGRADSWIRILRKLDMKLPVLIVALGGSMAAGVDCWQRINSSSVITGKQCSWPSRFVEWLRF